jgi:hypothetical protein
MLYQEEVELKHKVKIEIHNYSIKSSRYFREVTGKNGKSIQPIMVSNLVAIDQRNSYIYDLIYNLKEKEPSRKMLILSGRIDQLKKLNEMLKDVFEGEIGFYIGGMKEKDLKISESKDLILATYEMVSEGLDIQALDTMLLLTPKAKVVQTTGRILRKKPEEYENQPLIIDIVDQIPSFIFLGMARKKVYTSRNYEIVYHNVKEGIIEKTWEHDYTKEPKDRQPKSVEAAFIDTDEDDDPALNQVDKPIEKTTDKAKKKETKKPVDKNINITKEIQAFIDDDEPEPVKQSVIKVGENESKKAFEILESLNVVIKEVKKRAPRKKKTEI